MSLKVIYNYFDAIFSENLYPWY